MTIETRILAEAASTSYSYGEQELTGKFSWFDEISVPNTGLHAQIWKRINLDGTTEYIVAFTGTEESNQDYWTDANYGWLQYQALVNNSDWDEFKTAVFGDPNATINFTGHSLGGALAQYAAYDYLDPLNEYESNITLTTFNALGGEAGIIANKGSYDESRLIGLNATHYVIEQDGVSRLGNGHVGGSVLSLNVGDFLGSPLPVIDAHSISNFLSLDESDYLLAQPRPDTASAPAYLNIDSAQATMALLGGIGDDDGEFGDLEAAARLVAGLIPALMLTDESDLQSVANTFLSGADNTWLVDTAILLKDEMFILGFGVAINISTAAWVTAEVADQMSRQAAEDIDYLSIASGLAQYAGSLLLRAVETPIEYITDKVTDIVDSISNRYWPESVDTTIFGRTYDDLLVGTIGNNDIRGYEGNDTIWGQEGTDAIFGGAGDDVIHGGLGDDLLDGDLDNDTYVYQTGDGNDIIRDGAGVNQLVINGRTLTGVTLTAVSPGSTVYQELDANGNPVNEDLFTLTAGELLISVGGSGSGDSIRIITFLETTNDFGLSFVGAASETPTLPATAVTVDSSLETADLNGDGTPDNVGFYQYQRNDLVNAQGVVLDAETYTYYSADAQGNPYSVFRFDGTWGDDSLTGGSIGDVLKGDAGDDAISGLADDDVLEGGQGSDSLFGGLGNDRLWGDSNTSISHSDATLDESYTASNLNEDAGDADYLDGGAGDDALSGGSFRDVLIGGDGGDWLAAGAGGDELSGGTGNDFLYGDSRHREWIYWHDASTYSINWEVELISQAAAGLEYNDSIDGGSGNDRVAGELGNDHVFGGDGDDWIHGDRINDPNYQNHLMYFNPAIDPDIYQSVGLDYQNLDPLLHGNDVLQGGAGVDIITGNGGNDFLDGGADNDFLWGDDWAIAHQYHGNDILHGGSGDDQLVGDGGSDTLHGGAGNDQLWGDSLLAEGFDPIDPLYQGADELYGGDGSDQLAGGGGNDHLNGDAGADTLFGQEGDDVLNGGTDDDILHGNAGADLLSGDDGNDSLYGDADDDTLVGGDGTDYLAGGAGNDTYIVAGGGVDTLSDSEGQHTLVLNTAEELSYLAQDSTYTTLYTNRAYDRGLIMTTQDFGNVANIRVGAATYTTGEFISRMAADHGGTFHGTRAADQLTASTLDVEFFAGEGADTLTAGQGRNQFHGGLGDDTYVVNAGSGTTVIDSYDVTPVYDEFGNLLYNEGGSPNDILNLGDRNLGEFQLGKFNNDLVLYHAASNTSIRIANWGLSRDYQLAGIQFADGALTPDDIDFSAITHIIGDDSANVIDAGTIVGATVHALGGNDTIADGSGSTLYGGLGDDRITLHGGNGRGQAYYSLGDGNDTVSVYYQSYLSNSEKDQFVFDSSVLLSDVQFQRIDSDLTVTLAPTGEQVLFSGWYLGENSQPRILFESESLQLSIPEISLLGEEIDHDYQIDQAQGNVAIEDWGGQDTLNFGQGILAADVSFSRDGGALLINYESNSTVRVDNWFDGPNGKYQIERITFSESTNEFNSSEITEGLLTLVGTSGDDFLYGGDGVGDIFHAAEGTDTLYGYGGDDYYFFNAGDGANTIFDNGGFDRIVFSDEFNQDNLVFQEVGGDSLVTFSDNPSFSITRLNYYEGSEYQSYEFLYAVNGDNNDNTLQGNASRNYITGEAGDDVIKGLEGVDYIYGGDGNDTIYGDSDIETDLYSYRDTLFGGAGDDWLGDPYRWSAGTGNDYFGGTGNDTLVGTIATDRYYFERGDGVDSVFDNIGYDDSVGSSVTYSLSDQMYFKGISFSDMSIFRNGDDVILDFDYGDSVTIVNWFAVTNGKNDAFQVDQFIFEDEGLTLDAEDVTRLAEARHGTSGDDYLEGSSASQDLYGYEGNDTILALNGDDAIYGGPGDDIIDDGWGADRIYGGQGNDVFQDGGHSDTYFFELGDGHDRLIKSNAYTDTIIFGEGLTYSDATMTRSGDDLVIDFPSSGQSLTVEGFLTNEVTWNLNLTFPEGTTLAYEDNQALARQLATISGSEVNDDLQGTPYHDIIEAQAGNDIIRATSGDDTLIGGAGDDEYIFPDLQATTTTITDENGETYLSLPYDISQLQVSVSWASDGSHTLRLVSPNQTINITDGLDQQLHFQLTGSNYQTAEEIFTSLSESIVHSGSSSIMRGTDGADRFTGGLRDLHIEGRGGDDYISSTYGYNNFMDGGSGNDHIIASYGIDYLIGGDGNDTLDAGSGNDTLMGGSGTDILLGGWGNDTYMISHGDGVDRITDGNGVDVLAMQAGVEKGDVLVVKNRNDFELHLPESGSVIAVTNYYEKKSKGAYAIEAIEFADGTSWNQTDIETLLSVTSAPVNSSGTSANDVLQGYSLNDTLAGGDGLDTIHGGSGNDTLTGGAGDDFIAGGAGDDIYVYNLGDGSDTIDNNHVLSGTDKLVLGAGITAADTVAERVGNNLRLTFVDQATVLMTDYFVDPAQGDGLSQSALDEVHFNTGEIWTADYILNLVVPNEVPVANADTASTVEDTSVDILAASVLANDLDSDGDLLTVAGVTNPKNGTVAYDAAAELITFTPDPDFSGQASFEYVLTDGRAESNGTVTLEVSSVNDAPDGVYDSFTTEVDTAFNGSFTELLTNDQDRDGDVISISEFANPTNGTLSWDSTAETFNFVPDAAFAGQAGFDYAISDGQTTSWAHVDIEVVPPNSAPAAQTDVASTVESTAITIPLAGLLANDTDADGDTLNISGVLGATNGEAIIDAAAEAIVFTPSEYFTGEAEFVYEVSDGSLTDTANVSVSVLPDDTQPGAVLGTELGEILTGTRKKDALYGMDGNDTIRSGSGNDLLNGGAGDDVLIGDRGNDTYVFVGDGGMDIIDNTTSHRKDIDVLQMAGSFSPDTLWFSQSGNDLVIDVVGTNEQVAISDWYLDPDAQLDAIYAGGQMLANDQVDQLVSAMAQFDVPAGIGAVITPEQEQQLQPVIAASWTS